MEILQNVPLAGHTTFKLGGPARFFVRVQTPEELQEALRFAEQKSLPWLLLGGGSNLLVNDAGFEGLVIHFVFKGVSAESLSVTETIFIANAGEEWDTLVAQTTAGGFWGLENLSGIPGSVGGAVVQGIGAYGASVGQYIEWVEALDAHRGVVRRFSAAECDFGYRGSFFKHNSQYVVLRAAFRLSTIARPSISYKDLKERFEGRVPSLLELREAVLSIRKNKFPDLSVEGTAGSFFKNPILSIEEAAVLEARYPSMPTFSLPESAGVKIPLAWLLDHVLGLKGSAVGGARLYEKQALVIAASREARAHDVVLLAQKIKNAVREQLQIEIEEEVKIL